MTTCVHHSAQLHTYTKDPTHTLTLRNAFARQMSRRFSDLQRVVLAAVVVDDCFGLEDNSLFPSLRIQSVGSPGYRAFAFPTSQAKVTGFMKWFNQQVDAGVLEVSGRAQVGQALDKRWTDTYIKQSYERGVDRGREELLKAGYDVPPLEASGGIWGAFNTPMHLDRVGVLYSRTFTGLKGITAAMDTQISQVLSMGLVDGLGTKELGRQLYRTIGSGLGMTDKLGRFIPAKRRAKMLARTEIIRAHHQATIQEYENWRVEGVYVKAELVTGADPCPECSALEGIEFKLEEIRNMIPVHPNCKCVTIPIDKTKKGEKQKEVVSDEFAATEKLVSDRTSGINTFPTAGHIAKNGRADLSKYRGVKDDEWMDWAADPEPYQEALMTTKTKIFGFQGEELAGKVLDDTRDAAIRMQAAAKNSAIEQTTVVRGESYASSEEVMAKYKTRRVVKLDKMTSTTMDETAAMEYAKSEAAQEVPVVIRFTNPNGIRGVQTAPMGVPSNEVLLPFGDKYRVARVYVREDGVHIVDLYSKQKHKGLFKIDALAFSREDTANAAMKRLLQDEGFIKKAKKARQKAVKELGL